LKSRAATSEEPFAVLVSKAKKKNTQKGFQVHNTRSRGMHPNKGSLSPVLFYFYLVCLFFLFFLFFFFLFFAGLTLVSISFAFLVGEGFGLCHLLFLLLFVFIYIYNSRVFQLVYLYSPLLKKNLM
jgi:hypothetical protein